MFLGKNSKFENSSIGKFTKIFSTIINVWLIDFQVFQVFQVFLDYISLCQHFNISMDIHTERSKFVSFPIHSFSNIVKQTNHSMVITVYCHHHHHVLAVYLFLPLYLHKRFHPFKKNIFFHWKQTEILYWIIIVIKSINRCWWYWEWVGKAVTKFNKIGITTLLTIDLFYFSGTYSRFFGFCFGSRIWSVYSVCYIIFIVINIIIASKQIYSGFIFFLMAGWLFVCLPGVILTFLILYLCFGSLYSGHFNIDNIFIWLNSFGFDERSEFVDQLLLLYPESRISLCSIMKFIIFRIKSSIGKT